jgi:hypothetical protein
MGHAHRFHSEAKAILFLGHDITPLYNLKRNRFFRDLYQNKEEVFLSRARWIFGF